MKIAVSGSTGLIGSAFVRSALACGHEVFRLVRPGRPRADCDISWDPIAGIIDASALEGVGAVVHLAGESIAGRWTGAKKRRIYQSRIIGTQVLSEALAGLASPPKVFACASAVGYYGDCADEISTEESPPGCGFLSDLCVEWETIAARLAREQIRVVNLRFAMVLSADGGAMAKMLPTFRLGLGARLGNGRQHWNWITLNDTVRAILFLLENESIAGPVNVVSPNTVTNAEFTRILAGILDRPAFLSMPSPLVRLFLGRFGTDVLLASSRAVPARLIDAGFSFNDTDLKSALASLLQKTT